MSRSLWRMCRSDRLSSQLLCELCKFVPVYTQILYVNTRSHGFDLKVMWKSFIQKGCVRSRSIDALRPIGLLGFGFGIVKYGLTIWYLVNHSSAIR